jgi:hypothetical protein
VREIKEEKRCKETKKERYGVKVYKEGEGEERKKQRLNV